MIQGFSGGLLNRQLIYNLDLPSFQRDFASLKTLDHGTGPAITFTRASNATYFDANGVLQTAANDVPRFDHSQDGSASSLGLLIEESRTNSIRNSQAGGSTNGVIGSGGVMPSNGWFSTASGTNGITIELLGSGTENGLSYIDIKYSGTPNATVGFSLDPESTTQVVASNGQTWTHSNYLKVVGGSTTNMSIQLSVIGRTAAGAGVSGQTFNSSALNITSTLTRNSHTATFSSASVERVHPRLTLTLTSGNPIDLTLRIAAPQLEQGAFPTSYIPTTTAAATRGADSAVVTPISSFWNNAEGTVYAETFIERYGGSFPAVLQFNNGTNNTDHWLLFYNAASNNLSLGSTDFTLTVASPALSTVHKYAAGVSTNSGRGYLNTTASTEDTSITMVSNKVRLDIGGQVAGINKLNGHIRKIAYYPRRLSNTLLEQLTT